MRTLKARTQLIVSGLFALALAVLVILGLTLLYWPFQAAVQVTLPFVVVGVLVAIGLSALLTAHFLPVDMLEAPLTGTPRWADWLSLAAVAFAVLGLLVAVALPGPLNPAVASPAFVTGYGVVTGCTPSPAATTFEIHYANTGAADATGVTARYVLYALNATTSSYGATISIGTVSGRSSGSVEVTAPVACGPYGSGVTVAFAWS